ncbi:MAG: DUF721 domain-containing protein [Ignavibacteriaceae bacterium]|nr:DUF721 domain-containing protein [Ignavibacteriaceae bacterium]
MDESNFKTIGEVLTKEPIFQKLNEAIKNEEIKVNFEKIFPGLSEHIEVVKTEKSVLFLKVHNSVFRNDVKANEELYINKINTFFKEERIKKIKLS